jgi:hypothetical protein
MVAYVWAGRRVSGGMTALTGPRVYLMRTTVNDCKRSSVTFASANRQRKTYHCLNLLGLGTVLVLGLGSFELVGEGADGEGADADVLLGPAGKF